MRCLLRNCRRLEDLGLVLGKPCSYIYIYIYIYYIFEVVLIICATNFIRDVGFLIRGAEPVEEPQVETSLGMMETTISTINYLSYALYYTIC